MQHESRNISMLMDFYEMTMAHGYFTKLKNVDRVAFDVFFRRNPDKGGFAIFGGLEQIVEYILNLHFDESDISYLRSQGIFSEEFLAYLKDFSFTGDVYAFPEGSIIYPNEPVITIVAPLIDAQIIETAVLTMMNHQSLIATKANRIVRAADGRIVADFGARRAHNVDAAVYGARAAYIGGVQSTATVLAGQQFGIPVIPPRASLVPFTYRETDKFLTALSGISLPVTITAQCGKSFHNQLLFTHRGISGPAVLQISNYWKATESVEIDLLPNHNVEEEINQAKQHSPKQMLKTILVRLLPKKLVELWIEQGLMQDEVIANISKVRVKNLVDFIHHWEFTPNGTEGYRTAEVTMGGVDTKVISSKTMESNQVSGLYFIGEVLDVTGWLGGYNFQWAWSSAYACSQGISEK